jgi:hypothetical protein
MKKTFLTILFLTFAVATVFGQSGRIKPTPDESPSKDRERIVYVPTQLPNPKAKPKPTPTPMPTPKKIDEDDEIIRVESALVPIPVSVTDPQGRAITTLKLEDFTLEIDGKPAEISELSRSMMTPVRLALLFDNSSSVRIAREFEKNSSRKRFGRAVQRRFDDRIGTAADERRFLAHQSHRAFCRTGWRNAASRRHYSGGGIFKSGRRSARYRHRI